MYSSQRLNWTELQIYYHPNGCVVVHNKKSQTLTAAYTFIPLHQLVRSSNVQYEELCFWFPWMVFPYVTRHWTRTQIMFIFLKFPKTNTFELNLWLLVFPLITTTIQYFDLSIQCNSLVWVHCAVYQIGNKMCQCLYASDSCVTFVITVKEWQEGSTLMNQLQLFSS